MRTNGSRMAQVIASLYVAMTNGAESLHLMNMEAKEIDTIATAMAANGRDISLADLVKESNPKLLARERRMT